MLVDELKQVQATAFAFARKTHYFHWNVEGPDFIQYHDFLGELYAEVDTSVDVIAELIRTLNVYAPGAWRMLNELSLIKDDQTIPSALEMMIRVKDDNETLLNALRVCYQTAEQAGQLGISNYLQDRIQTHEKHAWMLRSITR
jgi:starvation-inducible DNA-binding protein